MSTYEELPRRIKIDQFIPAETAIHAAQMEIENLPADVRLTDIGIKLAALRDDVADWAESTGNIKPASDPVTVGSAVLPEFDEDCKTKKVYALTLQSGEQYSIVSLSAELACRERQLLAVMNQQLRHSGDRNIPARPFLCANYDGRSIYETKEADGHFTLLETQLSEAIAQRDAARNECLELRTQWKERAINAEDDLATSTMRINGDADRIAELEAALAAMTDDRNLWQNAHDEDCPNKAALDTERKDKAQLQYALEQSESKFPAERARVLQEAAEAILERQRVAASLPASSGDRAYAKGVKHSHEAVIALIQK